MTEGRVLEREPSGGAAGPATPRLVLLGASNLTRMLPAIVDLAQHGAGGRVEVLAAPGFGRSYGLRSRFLSRELPGILECGMWAALAERGRRPATGVVMDVGNDILYGQDPGTIAGWVDTALARLRPHVDQLVVGGIPPRLDRLGRLRFVLLRSLLFPGCRLPHDEAIERATTLALAVAAAAERHGARFVPMRPEWYGIDPIHVRPGAWRAAAAALLGLDAGGAGSSARVPRLALWRLAPALRWKSGEEQRTDQPAVRLKNGTTVAAW